MSSGKSSPSWHQNEEEVRGFLRERLVLDLTERILEIMERDRVSQKEIAQRLRITESRVSQILNGGGNLTIGTIADLYYSVGRAVEVSDVRVACALVPSLEKTLTFSPEEYPDSFYEWREAGIEEFVQKGSDDSRHPTKVA